MPVEQPHPLSDDPDDELSIDLLNDSFFLDGMASIMAEARARGAGLARPAEPAAGRPTCHDVADPVEGPGR